jgi:hypothetical protein
VRDINHTRWSELLRRLAGRRGFEQLTQLPDVFPTLPLEDPSALELLALRETWPWLVYVNTGAGGAGTYAQVAIENVAGSGKVTVVERLWNIAGAAAQLALLNTTAAAVAAMPYSAAVTRDPRKVDLTAYVAGRHGTTVGIAPATAHLTMQANTPEDFQWVLTPGTALLITAVAANTNITLGLWGYSRALAQDEV